MTSIDTTTTTCLTCGGVSGPTARFCSVCGHALPPVQTVPAVNVPTQRDCEPELPQPKTGHRRRTVLLCLGILAVAGAGTATLVRSPSDARGHYLHALRANGQGGQFASDAAAVAHATHVCNVLKSGGSQQGMPVDLTGVRYYCPQFDQGFHVLQTATINGTFELDDTSWIGDDYGSSSISTDGGTCEGTSGYSDIASGTQVVVADGSGRTLATTYLGEGSGGDTKCVFDFSFQITEGASDYAVTISHRGTQHYTFTQLLNDGLHLTLGN